MNDVIQAILERRSIRAYKSDIIPQDQFDLIVKAGLYAPSSKNAQAWHITVIQNRLTIDQITKEVKAAIQREKVERYMALATSSTYTVNFGSPNFVIVTADPTLTSCPNEDCALLLGNMFLAAHSLGIGSCWINQLCPVCDDEEFRTLLTGLGVPTGNKIYGSAVFGYPAVDHPAAPPRMDKTVNFVK